MKKPQPVGAMAFAIIEVVISIRVEDLQQRVLYLLRYLRIS